jgi:hypothetical protein
LYTEGIVRRDEGAVVLHESINGHGAVGYEGHDGGLGLERARGVVVCGSGATRGRVPFVVGSPRSTIAVKILPVRGGVQNFGFVGLGHGGDFQDGY